MNFGKWIVVAFVLFALFIGTLVTVCVRQDISLVSKEYYRDELAYQDQMVRISNAQRLKEKPSISKIGGNLLQVKFRQPIGQGVLKLFCPSDPKMDRSIDLKLSPDNDQPVDVASLKPGMYRAKLFWTEGGKDYFLEEVIYL